MATIYRKTGKGQHEIDTRALRLAPRFRSLLILVDGRRSDEELLQLMPSAGPEALEALGTLGLIEVIGITPERPPSARSRAAVPATPDPQSPAGFEQRRRDVVRDLTNLIGPAADTLAIRIERCADVDQLSALVRAAAQIVASMRGRAAADAFLQRHLAAGPPA
ncbi:MAG: hypothetical protein U1F56_06200 [Rubrivivax sp.]